MQREETRFLKKNGFILFMVLLFLFVLTLLAVDDSQEIIICNKMYNNLNNHTQVFARAEWGMAQMIFTLEGHAIALPDSPIFLHEQIKILKTDECGNKTVILQSTAKNTLSKVVLNSRDIFGSVPRRKNCKKIPPHKRLWWHVQHGNDSRSCMGCG